MTKALPSAILEPLVAGAFMMCLDELVRSAGEQADFDRFYEQVRGIDRVVTANRCSAPVGGPNRGDGVHLSMAMSNHHRQAYTMKHWSRDAQVKFLAELRDGRAAAHRTGEN